MTGKSEPAGLLARLKAAGIVPRRSLGQNFLHDPGVLESLAEAAELSPEDHVFEVGTGPGTLTRHLARRARRVISVEVDKRLAAFARRELGSLDNVEILEDDVLETKSSLHPRVLERLRGLGEFKWVANLPYAIATPLILTFLEADLAWKCSVLTLQVELADKLCAQAGERAYGSSTALLSFWAHAKRLRRIGAGTFWPRPGVDSAVIRLEPRRPVLPAAGYAAYRAWVRVLFRSRRKQLRTLLRHELGPEVASEALACGGWPPTSRPESLQVADFLLLAEKFPLFG